MNSLLNPEAPEFYPHLTSVTQGGYSTVHKSILSSNQMPMGASYNVFKTITDFNIMTCHLSENVVFQSNQIFITELPRVKWNPQDHDYNTERVVDTNDSMLDRININIDKVNNPNDSRHATADYGVMAPWNSNPVITRIQVGSTMFIGGKNVQRPQLTFKEPVDNSENLWVPKISDKPNNRKPLALNILYNDGGEAIGYEHPYKVELDLYQPPDEFLRPTSSPPVFPAPVIQTKLTIVTTEAQVDALVEHLNDVTEIAVDVEHHSYRTYQGITCVIQISTDEGGDFIIDALAVRDHVHKLNLAFTDPKKIKVFHGAELDVIWLQRDFGVYIVGLFDTHQAARALNISGLSLKHLLARYCNVNADKRYQLADWRIRPLPIELLEYARMDTHYLLYIWRTLKNELLQSEPHMLMSVFKQSLQLCGRTYNKEVVREDSHMPLYLRSRKAFNSRQMAALRMLYKWRDAQARMHDESTTYLLPNHMLLALAENLPREVQGVNAICVPMPPFVKQNLITVHRMLLSCRELPMEPQLYQMPTTVSTMMTNTQQQHFYIHDFSNYVDYQEGNINLDQAADVLEEFKDFQPDIPAFIPNYNNETQTVISDLNAEAKLFYPPYERYKKYRSIAQMEEVKEYKNKQAKIAAIGKGNELIKTEVLVKLQQATTQIENADKKDVKSKKEPSKKEEVSVVEIDLTTDEGVAKRKRKFSCEKERNKSVVNTEIEKDAKSKNNKNVKSESNPKPFPYKNVNYRKFYDKSDKGKQPKAKFTKH